MNKRLIICCDGTWNEPDSKPTNVVKLVRAIRPVDENDIHQIVFYDQGVGTQGLIDKCIGGGLGVGVRKNILDAYRFLVHNYNQGDEIYCFGFSRGAYTARALGGMLNATGLISKDELSQLTEVYKYYRTHPGKRKSDKYQNNIRPDITMMGVWDTVGALGAPTPLLSQLSSRFISFFDTTLSPYIKNAFHALAIDEQRGPFKPDLWSGSPIKDQRVEQVWFAGVHSDIGGGYINRGLSDITLQWMIEKAQEAGLEFDSDMISSPEFINPDMTQEIHNSFSTGYQWLSYLGVDKFPRQLSGSPNNPPINVSIHPSVEEKFVLDETYQPQNYEPLTVPPSSRATHDNRKLIRQLAKCPDAQVNLGGSENPCQIIDFHSLGGAKLKSDLQLELQDRVTLSSKYFAQTVGNIVWKRGNHYGVEFAS